MKTLRLYSVIILGILSLIKLLEVPILYLDFQLRQDFIAQNLCENIDIPDLHCEGHCFLNKQMKQATDSDQETGKESSAKLFLEIFYSSLSGEEFTANRVALELVKTPYLNIYSFFPLNKILHPPQVV